MFITDAQLILTVWLSTLLLGWASWPVTSLFFRNFSDRGYTLSKITGWIIIAYAILVLSTIHILPLSLSSLVLLVIFWVVLNGWVFLRTKFKFNRKLLFSATYTEILYLSLMLFWLWVRGHNPEIHSIERFMDFGFIRSLFNNRSLPLEDIWMSGQYVNYYYFGHLIGYVVLQLTKIPLVPGFFVLVCWLFGLVGVNCFQLGKEVSLLISGSPNSPIHHFTSSLTRQFAGLLSVFFVLFAGTWQILPWFFGQLLAPLHLLPQSSTLNPLSSSYWFPEPTRIIPGTISEMPIYTFIVADLHAHMWGLLNGLLVLSLLLAFWTDKKAIFLLRSRYFWLLAFFLGIAYITNAWDAVTLGGLTVLVIGYKLISTKKYTSLLNWLVLPPLAYLVSLPWSWFFKSPLLGVGIVKSVSPLPAWVSFWGPFTLLMVFFALRLLRIKLAGKLNWNPGLEFISLVFLASAYFVILLEIVYFQDILKDGIYYRANTYFKVTTQVWLWLGILAGPVCLWLVSSYQSNFSRVVILLLLIALTLSVAVYPLKAISQSSLEGRKYAGLGSGLAWWQKAYPGDHEAYRFLQKVRDSLPENDKIRRVLEADGESYSETSRFATFLGWPTVAGWAVHEWTWHGSFEKIGKRAKDVREIYTGEDMGLARKIIRKYKIDYIIAGQVEQERYKDKLNRDKLINLGKVIFNQGSVVIVQVAGA